MKLTDRDIVDYLGHDIYFLRSEPGSLKIEASHGTFNTFFGVVLPYSRRDCSRRCILHRHGHNTFSTQASRPKCLAITASIEKFWARCSRRGYWDKEDIGDSWSNKMVLIIKVSVSPITVSIEVTETT